MRRTIPICDLKEEMIARDKIDLQKRYPDNFFILLVIIANNKISFGKRLKIEFYTGRKCYKNLSSPDTSEI